MPLYLILCQTSVTAKTLEAWRELLLGVQLQGFERMPAPIVFDPAECSRENGVIAYRSLVQHIETAADLGGGSPWAGKEVIVMVDNVRPNELSAISEVATWDHLVAMLVLTFPEVRWIFGVIRESPSEFPAEAHNLLSLVNKPGREPLLDPTGLRAWVRSRTNEQLRRLGLAYNAHLPKRFHRAASIDEEPEYALIHGYAAYRYGFLSDVITSWTNMLHLFGRSGEQRADHGYSLIIEDMRLNFPDKPARVHLSRLEACRAGDGTESGRGHHCPLLSEINDTSLWRFLVTTGQTGGDRELAGRNSDYLDRKVVGRGGVIFKPLGGIIDLWDKAGLTRDLHIGSRSGNAPEFIWPPMLQDDGLMDGHGSPGKLVIIANMLLQRANGLRGVQGTATEFIRGAVLALEATELLGGKTPTTTLTGLLLRHEYEVRAECAFVGAGYHFRLGRRLQELTDEVRAVTKWFHEPNQNEAEWDANSTILNRLILVFREAGQVEEERECLVALRRLNRKMNRPRNLNPISWFAHAVLSYGEWLLASFDRIILLTTLWVLALAEAAWLIKSKTFADTFDATSTVIGWFLGGSAAPSESWILMMLSWVVGFGGVFHLGVFIAYFYSLISRK